MRWSGGQLAAGGTWVGPVRGGGAKPGRAPHDAHQYVMCSMKP